MIKLSILWSLSCALLMISLPLFGHHGTNISYDHSKPITLTGTVTEFVWQNPHTQVYFDVKDASGKIVHWAGEMNSPGVLIRQEGWTRKTLKVGDEITVTVFPSKAGTPVGVVNKMLLNGKAILDNRGGQQQ
jgi:uncharacterized protein DUF6152